MNCFPIALQANTTEDFSQAGGNEINLVVELAESVIDITSKLFGRKKTSANFTEYKRISLAQDSQTPADVLLKLSSDESSSVRSALIFNPIVPAIVLFKLASDNDRFVSAQARARISMAA